jgi:hypothetical protein
MILATLVGLACITIMLAFWRQASIVIGVFIAFLILVGIVVQVHMPAPLEAAPVVHEWKQHRANPDMLCTTTKAGVLSCRLR